ncbi:hypothetical protein SAMN02745866_01474 [Alteromonadaceae bacterium Bs31]|nr:hypothetical protein SAMN02745866_01474 [Alteromonadaceae bacterium Bs31]
MAHERELRNQFSALRSQFASLEQGGADIWRLKKEIETFTYTTMKALDTTYLSADPVFAVAYAIKQGVLQAGEVPAEYHAHFADLLNSKKM